ncbi:MAG: B12-binding domain-containing radical SAM protein [Nitrospirae bacterium]|nr:B12-binding domain-containing radical SAM protein [Nitrospirota bacterium]
MGKILLAKARYLTPNNFGMTPPLGLMYLASYLRLHSHHEVRIVDVGYDQHPYGELVDTLRDFRPDLVGLSALTAEATAMHWAAAQVKACCPDTPVIVGGPHASSYPREVLSDPRIDYLCIGEGEKTFHEFVEQWFGGGRPEDTDGIAFRRDKGVFFSKRRNAIENLDALPFPAWDLVDVHAYGSLKSMSTMGRRPYMALFTSRGCPYRCTYCHENFGKDFRPRSPDNVLAEVDEIIGRYGIKDFEIVDDIFNWDLSRGKTILDGIASRGPGTAIHFPNGLRCDRMDREFLEKSKEAGCQYLCVAVETVTPRLQLMIKKNLKLDRVKWTIEESVRLGIFTNGFFMLGFPSETEDEIRSTIDFAVRSPLTQAMFFIVTPFAGTALGDWYRIQPGAQKPSFRDFEYFHSRFNLSAISTDRLYRLQAEAYREFYLDARRLLGIVRHHPRKSHLPELAWTTLKLMLLKDRGNLNPAALRILQAPPHSPPDLAPPGRAEAPVESEVGLGLHEIPSVECRLEPLQVPISPVQGPSDYHKPWVPRHPLQ